MVLETHLRMCDLVARTWRKETECPGLLPWLPVEFRALHLEGLIHCYALTSSPQQREQVLQPADGPRSLECEPDRAGAQRRGLDPLCHG